MSARGGAAGDGSRSAWWTPLIVAGALGVVAAGGAEAEPASPGAGESGSLEELPSSLPEVPELGSLLWDVGSAVRTWGGYKDNPLLSAATPQGSWLVAGAGEVYVTRLPTDGREVTVFATLEHTEYTTDGVSPETMGIVDARVRRSWDGGWFAGGTLEYLYFRQVFDASDITGVLAVLRAEGHMALARPAFGYEWAEGWKLEAELEGVRQWLAAPLDDYWDGGVRVTGSRDWGALGTGSASYRFRRRWFDDRGRLDGGGGLLDGSMRFSQHEVELAWRRTWDEAKHWRTTLKLGWVDNQDNGGGYFDYHRIQGTPSVRYVAGPWEARAEARLRAYVYPVQPASAGGSERLRRYDLGGTLRGQVRIAKGWRVFAQYEYEASDSNAIGGDYDVNSTWIGLEYEPSWFKTDGL